MDRDQVVEVYGRRLLEFSLESGRENTAGNEFNRSSFVQILATTRERLRGKQKPMSRILRREVKSEVEGAGEIANS